MSKERVEDSPLSRARLTLGATQTSPSQQSERSEEHKDIKTPANQSTAMRRTTVYIPDELAIKLKLYAVRHRDDVSGIITKQIELLLADEG